MDRRPPWRKPTGVVGYFATAISTFAYAFAQTWPVVLALRGLGWAGRGSRGPSRDTLLADAVEAREIGRAFGFERAMDTAGAVAGPLCATAFIGFLGVRGVLRWTLLPGMLAALAFAFLAPAGKDATGVQARGFVTNLGQLPRGFWHFLAGVFAHGIGDFAPTLLILRAAQIFAPRYGSARAAVFAAGLYSFHNLINAATAYPAGSLGDRMSKRGLLAAGYLVAAIAYAGFIFAPPTLPLLAVLFALAGIHVAMQQSLEKSLAAELLPGDFRGSGFGVLATANGIGDLASSVIVGLLWSSVGPAAGFIYAGIFTLVGAVLIYRWR